VPGKSNGGAEDSDEAEDRDDEEDLHVPEMRIARALDSCSIFVGLLPVTF